MKTLLILALLLCTAPAWATPVELTSGRLHGELPHDFALEATLDGPGIALSSGIECCGDFFPLGLLSILKPGVLIDMSGTGVFDNARLNTFSVTAVPFLARFDSGLSGDEMRDRFGAGILDDTDSTTFTIHGFEGDTEFTGRGTVLISYNIVDVDYISGYTYTITPPLIATPEPATWLLLGTGLVLLSLHRRHRWGASRQAT